MEVDSPCPETRNLRALGGHYRRQMEQELEREQRSREIQGWMR